jgi:type III restriction enzyme
MKIQFDSSQQFQTSAVESIVGLFKGQSLSKGNFELSLEEGSLKFNYNGIGNNLILNENQILKNLNLIQNLNNIPISPKLDGLNFTIEMETGTGKTYVYLKTIYELHKTYGFKKFIIVVPSIAIREGVLKNLEITKEHFQNLYSNPTIDYYLYDPKKISNLKNFASVNAIQILVINIDSFAKDYNIINQATENRLKPIEYLQNTNPIVIIDEPQNMETDNRKNAIKTLSPLFTIRYSATHKNIYNPVYKLDPVQAYDLGLVKQIEVDGIANDSDYNSAFIKFEKINQTKKKISVKLKIFFNEKSSVKHKSVTASVGDNLFDLSNQREMYKEGFIINSIDAKEKKIEFSNGLKINLGQSNGGLSDEVIKFQIERTIESHLKKEKKYNKLGIKVLSIFFIDRVSNYRKYDNKGNPLNGKYAMWFENIYKTFISKDEFKDLNVHPINKLHDGYFSKDKGKIKDTSGLTKSDQDTYNLIMKDKEKLLSMDEPLKFIFTHSALREGWDNPNVFQICTLNETQSDIKKRQELGRGLRLPINDKGIRIFDKNINLLTVIANESYADFSKKLQNEIEEDCNIKFENKIKDARAKKLIKLTKNINECKEFIEIWDLIKNKTTYNVHYSTEELIKRCIKEIASIPQTARPLLTSSTYQLDYSSKGVGGKLIDIRQKTIQGMSHIIPDVYSYIQSKIDITRETIFKILKESERFSEIEINPQMFLDNIILVINNVLNELMVDGIKYEKISNNEYEMKIFYDEEIETYLSNLFKVTKESKTLYNYIEFQSDTESKFARDCELDEKIKFYFKLPKKFKIPTPIGNYNPDWAVIFENDSKIYFVLETKSSLNSFLIRNIENLKIQCGIKHFKEFKNISYKKITDIKELYN